MNSISRLFKKHLAGRHDQKKHGANRQSTTNPRPLNKQEVEAFLNKWGPEDKSNAIYEAYSALSDTTHRGVAKRHPIGADFHGLEDQLPQYGVTAKQLTRLAQSVQNDLQYGASNAQGFCAVASVLLWTRMGRPKNLVPWAFDLPDTYHVMLYDERNRMAVDVTHGQFGGPNNLVVNKIGEKPKSKLSARAIGRMIVDESVSKKQKVAKALHLELGIFEHMGELDAALEGLKKLLGE